MTYTTQHQQRTETGDILRTGILIVAVMTTGMLAGVFTHWSDTIMPGLSDLDDRTYIEAQQALGEAILNPLFLGGFTIALLLIGLSAALHLGADQRRVLLWVGAALVFYLVVCVVTFGVHEPLNEKLRTPGDLDSNADFAALRTEFDGATWTAWNTVRAVASTITFGCLLGALVVRCRLGRSDGRRR